VVVGFIIRALKGVPLPTGMFDVFFQKNKNDFCLSRILERILGIYRIFYTVFTGTCTGKNNNNNSNNNNNNNRSYLPNGHRKCWGECTILCSFLPQYEQK